MIEEHFILECVVEGRKYQNKETVSQCKQKKVLG